MTDIILIQFCTDVKKDQPNRAYVTIDYRAKGSDQYEEWSQVTSVDYYYDEWASIYLSLVKMCKGDRKEQLLNLNHRQFIIGQIAKDLLNNEQLDIDWHMWRTE